MSLFDKVQQLNKECEENKEELMAKRKEELEQKRKIAREEALKTITEGCVEKMEEAAKSPTKNNEPRKEARIYEWNFSDQVQFNNCFLRDLLNKGNLLADLQEWFDTNHAGPDGKRMFKVYYTKLGRSRPKYQNNDRKYGIFVSWNQDDWERIDNLLNNMNDRFKGTHQPHNNQPRNNQPRNNQPRNNNNNNRRNFSNHQNTSKVY